MITTITPETESQWLEMRKLDVTSTEVSALFGLSPYLTKFELWHLKKGLLDSSFEATERTEWGLALQDAIAAKIAAERGWKIRRKDEYARLPTLRAGASFDFEILEAEDPEDVGALIEVKNVDALVFRASWTKEDGATMAPDHIELQVQQQLMLSARKRAYIVVLVGGNKAHVLRRDIDADIVSAITASIQEFWQSIEAEQPPAPDYPSDASAVQRLFGRAEPGKQIDADTETSELIETHYRLGEQERRLSEARDVLKSMILERIQDAETAKCQIGDRIYTVSAGLIAPAEIAFTRAGYRNFRITNAAAKKPKEKAA